MNHPTQALRHHHQHCDDCFASAEALAQAGDWPGCEIASAKFLAEMEAHFATEEQVLFPAFVAATGMSGGPIVVMRMEHAQMRDLMAQLAGALKGRDRHAYGGAADALLILMQQHNIKEENILYPMCDGALAATAIDIGSALDERVGGPCRA